MEVKERFTAYLKTKHLSLNDFAKVCGISPSVLSRIGLTTADASLRKIDEASDLNIDWLMKGEGEMIKPASQSANNVNGHYIGGVNVNGKEVRITFPSEYETLLDIVNDNKKIVEKYQAQLDKAQAQIDELIALLKSKL